MPPKGPGRRARGGGAAGKASETSPRTDQEAAAPSASQDQSNGGAAASPIPISDAGSKASTPAPSQSSTPAPARTPSTRQQRAGSTPSGMTSRGGRALPKFAGRRAEAGRAELQKAEAERRKAELEQRAREEARKARREGRGRGWGAARGRTRGGYIGQTEERKQQDTIASGPFASAAAYDSRDKGKRKAPGTSGGSGSGSGGGGGGAGASFGGGTKGSYGDGTSSAVDFSGVSRTSTPGGLKRDPGATEFVSVKAEDGGYISSDDEEEVRYERQNVDDLEVVDLTGDDEGPAPSFAPIRIKRVEHKERTLGLNADGASAVDGAPNTGDVDIPDPHLSDRRRGKQRSKDVEVTQEQRRWQGAWNDSSESDLDKEPRVKEEPRDEDQATIAVPAEAHGEGVPPADIPSSPDSRRKAKEKIKRSSSSAATAERPVFQTADESAEWERHQADLRLLRSELGELSVAHPADGDGDATMSGTTTATRDQRADKVYLFQFPPVLPDLIPIIVKADPEAPADADGNAAASTGEAMDVDASNKEQQAVKTEDGADDISTNTFSGPKLPSGAVGKLRIHKSGKAFLDWGGTSLEVGMGTSASFLQDVLVARVDSKPEGQDTKMEAEEFGGMAIGMGQVKGKFVVTPDWGSILG